MINFFKKPYELINIQPPVSVYSTFSRLSYTIWHAIAEFVDNSTASYFLNKEKLNKNIDYSLKILILYNKDLTNRENDYLEISDNAYGMEKQSFINAVQLDKPPINKNGRNEFGMGLKTAACWFGKEWEITTTQMGSNNEFSVKMDIELISKNNQNTVETQVAKVDKNKHYTKIIIKKLNRKIDKRQRDKIKDEISSIYRNDLRNKEIKIKYVEKVTNFKNFFYTNDGKEKYDNVELVPYLSFEGDSIRIQEGQELKQNFDKVITFENKNFPVSGYIAVRDKGTRDYGGFTLLRRGRVIVRNYRPKNIFGDPSTRRYLWLIGEINMDEWPVMQAKNAFDWDSGLEDCFLNFLFLESEKFRNMVDTLRKPKKTLHEEEKIEVKNQDETSQLQTGNALRNEEKIKSFDEHLNFPESKIVEKLIEPIDEKPNSALIKNHNNSYEDLQIEIKHICDFSKKWIEIHQENSDTNVYKLLINLEHKFFSSYKGKKEFLSLINHFASAFTASLIRLKSMPKLEPIDSLKMIDWVNHYLLKNNFFN